MKIVHKVHKANIQPIKFTITCSCLAAWCARHCRCFNSRGVLRLLRQTKTTLLRKSQRKESCHQLTPKQKSSKCTEKSYTSIPCSIWLNKVDQPSVARYRLLSRGYTIGPSACCNQWNRCSQSLRRSSATGEIARVGGHYVVQSFDVTGKPVWLDIRE